MNSRIASANPARSRTGAKWRGPTNVRSLASGTKAGKAAYARRKAIVEPVFGQIDTCQGGKGVPLRGFAADDTEWALLVPCHNLRKLFGHTGITGLAGLASS